MKYSLFGESHGSQIGIIIEELPAGFRLDMEEIKKDMKRRAPNNSLLSTQRKEKDEFQIVSGLMDGITTGMPLCMQIINTDTRSRDYEETRWLARPSHSDYSAHIRYNGFNDFRGGGHFSGRLTAPLVFAGAIAKQILKQYEIEIFSHIKEVYGITDKNIDKVNPSLEELKSVSNKEFPVIDDAQGKLMQEAILQAREECDSVGGVIECIIPYFPVGKGAPHLNKSLEGIISQHMFAIPAVKGIEFGEGFNLARIKGSQANDEWIMQDSEITSKTNNNGGINGGISNGLPLVFSVAIKPTPSISKEQNTINMKTKTSEKLVIKGRHDPCIVPRAAVVVEAMTALAISDYF